MYEVSGGQVGRSVPGGRRMVFSGAVFWTKG